MDAVGESAIPFNDLEPFRIGDPRRWEEISRMRLRGLDRHRQPLTENERAIQQALTTPVSVSFTNRPLAEVLTTLGKMARVNIHLDQQGLAAEAVTSATPITINFQQDISLRSALNLILQPLHLSYVIQNEVLRVTSEQTRQTDVYPHVYNVADLVIPIPNFIPSYGMGLPDARFAKRTTPLATAARAPTSGAAIPLTVAANECARPIRMPRYSRKWAECTAAR